VTSLRFLLLAALAALAISTVPATATERIGSFLVYDDSSDVIALDGQIGLSTVQDFRRALDARPDATTVLLSSPGGYVDEALAIAREISRRGLSTSIPSGKRCYSACAYIFFAGRDHVVHGKLGVHSASAEGTGNAVYFDDVSIQLERFGVPAGVMQAMLATSPQDMHVFSKTEIASLSINRVSSKTPSADRVATR
jgi:hypothetical protein